MRINEKIKLTRLSVLKSVMFFSIVSEMSPNYPGKTFKLVLFECWVFWFVFWDKDECPILKITIQTITQSDTFWKISEIKIFRRQDRDVNELCFSQTLLAGEDIIKGKKLPWCVMRDCLRRQWRRRTVELARKNSSSRNSLIITINKTINPKDFHLGMHR